MEASDRKGEATNVNVPGTPHLGIILWPDVKKETTLVPPLPTLGRKALKNRKQALTIPFYGAYWFYRPPYLQPPSDPWCCTALLPFAVFSAMTDLPSRKKPIRTCKQISI